MLTFIESLIVVLAIIAIALELIIIKNGDTDDVDIDVEMLEKLSDIKDRLVKIEYFRSNKVISEADYLLDIQQLTAELEEIEKELINVKN